jgi:hypothetical protein
MLKTKTIRNLSILRILALVAIVSFSFEITSTFFVQDDIQIEIADLDLEDDNQDEEFDSLDLFIAFEAAETADSEASKNQFFRCSFKDQHLKELTTPPPDFA